MTTADNKYPHIFVHIGMHKTATTFLQNVYFPMLQGIEYIHKFQHRPFTEYMRLTDSLCFDADHARNLLLSITKSDKLLISEEMFCGSAWTGSVDRKRMLDFLFATFDNLHLILVIRNPIDLLNSMYLQYVKGGGTLPPLKFLNYRRPEFLHAKEYYNPLPMIRYIINQRGLDSLQILVYEDFRRNRELFLNKLNSFLGASLKDVINYNKVVNQSLGSNWVGLARFLNKLIGNRWNPNQLLPRKILTSYRRTVLLYLSRKFKTNKSVFKEDVAREFLNEVIDDYKVLDEMLHLNLKEYGYFD